MKNLDYLKMLKEIDELVENDFCYDMEMKSLFKKPNYTQEEAKKMQDIISRTYLIAHCIRCKVCSAKYKKLKK